MQGNTLNSQGTNGIIGKILCDRFQIIQHLGGGGFGQTYLAEDLQQPSNSPCVVKQLQPKSKNPDTLQTARVLFEREAKVLYQLGDHPQIPDIRADFEQDEQFYLVQEFIDGGELKQELPAGKRLSETQVIALLQEILQILEFVHDKGVIHRDIKPSNLIRRKQDGKIVLIDFGAVKQVSTQIIHPEGQTTLTVAIGSPGFMPNEQLSGKPRFCSDIYAVGMLGIQALTGIPANQLPEDPRTSEIIWRDREALPVDVEVEVSPQFADVLDKMVRYDYRQRFQTATEALQAIASLKNPSNSGDTSGTYTLTIPPASTANAVTATLPPQPSASKALVTSAPLQNEVQAGNVPISTLDKKSYWLKGIGAGLVTATALTVGFYQLPNAKLLNTNQLLASGQKTSPVNTLIGHSNEVYSVAISPDGQILVSGSVDKKIKLWSMPDGKPLKTLPAHQDKVMSVAISPDGRIIASGSKDGSIKLWNLKTGQLLRALSGHSEYVLSVAFSPDGQTIATSSADKTVKLWDVRTGKQVRSLSGHSNWVYAVAFSPDGQILADASDDSTIKLWHLPTGKLITNLSSPSGKVVRSVAFSPDGKTLVSGSYDQINLWNLENVLAGCKDASSCSPRKTFSGKLGIVDSIAISPDSQTLACGTKDKSIKLWNLQTGKLQDTISGLSDPVHTLTFSPDGKTLVSGGSEDGTIEVWRSR